MRSTGFLRSVNLKGSCSLAGTKDLGCLYESYLGKSDTVLHQLGDQIQSPVKGSPLGEFMIVKATSSEWKD
jgi:hypothetical protein